MDGQVSVRVDEPCQIDGLTVETFAGDAADDDVDNNYNDDDDAAAVDNDDDGDGKGNGDDEENGDGNEACQID